MSYALKATVSTPVGVFTGLIPGDSFTTSNAAADFRDELIKSGVENMDLIDGETLHVIPNELVDVSVFSYTIVPA